MLAAAIFVPVCGYLLFLFFRLRMRWIHRKRNFGKRQRLPLLYLFTFICTVIFFLFLGLLTSYEGESGVGITLIILAPLFGIYLIPYYFRCWVQLDEDAVTVRREPFGKIRVIPYGEIVDFHIAGTHVTPMGIRMKATGNYWFNASPLFMDIRYLMHGLLYLKKFKTWPTMQDIAEKIDTPMSMREFEQELKEIELAQKKDSY